MMTTVPATQNLPDLLNFKKGWMSVLDENGEWKKHWFVLTDSSLKYYRDSGAEEKDELDGEIDLRSCVNVTEFDVEKNYGFQIQTLNAVFILSAMTAGIRKNWIEVLRKSVRTGNTPDITQLPDSSSDKENSHSLGRTPSSRQQPSWQSTGAATPPALAAVRRFDYVELAPVTVALGVMPTSLRGAGEGQAREKGPGTTMEQRQRMEEEIEKKWVEFEKLPVKRMCSLPPMSSLGGQPANEALQREVVASLRQQLERKQSGGGGGGGGVGGMGHCGPEAPCGRSLEAMERAHQHALAELQRRHDRETRELEKERDRLLKEEAQATAQAMEALKKAHREETERELEAVRRLVGASADVEALQRQQESERQAQQRELDGLSERYSQKCLELNRAMQSGGERERELSRREAEMEQLKKDNQVLQARLLEEISRMHSLAKSPGSDGIPHDGRQPDSCHLEVLLRMKENEVQYLLKEIGCLREELQALNMEKREACKRYKEVHAELSGMKSRSEREVVALKEHLKLAMAALQEGQRLGNSLDH
ncbi:TRIO and F-actin binding protein b isoform X3 [Brienomyrus brachyistius]|uniref:TRIO and F-actin binding protein b isoform X3 n=1 Tax=Brienomyrus brachyistius TaxID=42636 RepID=UPI0020B4073E|nr:TRIO and F-actin binding protein b isoform X3 [Brienomyrus brachyistius]